MVTLHEKMQWLLDLILRRGSFWVRESLCSLGAVMGFDEDAGGSREVLGGWFCDWAVDVECGAFASLARGCVSW